MFPTSYSPAPKTICTSKSDYLLYCRPYLAATGLTISLTFMCIGVVVAQTSIYSYQAGANAFMSGSRANLGVSAEIQTHIYSIDYPNTTDRADLFFVGSTLVNGGFVQFGFGFEPGLLCLRAFVQLNGAGKCMGGWHVIPNGDARWFWEYWPDYTGRLGVYTQIGPSMSAGADGTWHTFTISGASNRSWSFILDGEEVASLNVTPAIATDNPYVAAEAVTTQEPGQLGPVRFQNISYLSSGVWRPVVFLKTFEICGSPQSPLACPYANPYNATLIGANGVVAGSLANSIWQSTTSSTTTSITSSRFYTANAFVLVCLIGASGGVIAVYMWMRSRKHDAPE